jgi:hypothetical protein
MDIEQCFDWTCPVHSKGLQFLSIQLLSATFKFRHLPGSFESAVRAYFRLRHVQKIQIKIFSAKRLD